MLCHLRLVARRKRPGRSRAQCRFCRRCSSGRGSGRWGRRLFCSLLGSGLFRRGFLRSSRLLGRCSLLRWRGLLCSSLRCSFLRCSLLRWCGLLRRRCLLRSCLRCSFFRCSLRCCLLGRCGLLGGSSLLSGYFLGRCGLLCRGFFCRSFLCSCHNDLLDQVTKYTALFDSVRRFNARWYASRPSPLSCGPGAMNAGTTQAVASDGNMS